MVETRDWRLEIGSGRLTDFGVGKFPVPFGWVGLLYEEYGNPRVIGSIQMA